MKFRCSTIVILLAVSGLLFGKARAGLDFELIAYSAEDNALYEISASTAEATKIGTLQIADSADISCLAGATETALYTIGRADNILYTIDRNDASTLSAIQLDGDVKVNSRGLDISPAGPLYGIFEQNELRTINSQTGATTLSANIQTPLMEAIAFSPSGTLYGGTGAGHLYQVSIETGNISLVANTPLLDIDALTFAPDGYLYAADSEANYVADLYRIDPLTGVATNLGSTGLKGLNGLQAIPEPATLLFFGLGALVLCSNKR